jgi:hypothetical protein
VTIKPESAIRPFKRCVAAETNAILEHRGLGSRAEPVAKKISVSADGIEEAEKRATSADIFALKSLNGTGGSNPPLSASQSQL